MNAFQKVSPNIQWIEVGKLSVVWLEAQRPLDDKKVKQIVRNFDRDLFGVLTVTQANSDGVHHLIDGNHRKTAAEELFGASQLVPCEVKDAGDPARAAAIFIGKNTTQKAVTSLDNFRVKVTAGYETEVAVNEIVQSLGLSIHPSPRVRNIRATGALVNVYKKAGPVVLRETLSCLSAMWGEDKGAFEGAFIEGLAAFVSAHPQIDWTRLRTKTAKEFTPARLMARAKGYRELHRCTLPEAVRQVLHLNYDAGLRTNRLGSSA